MLQISYILEMCTVGLGDVCQIGKWRCLQLNIVMDNDIVIYEFEAACLLSVVASQHLLISLQLYLTLFPTIAQTWISNCLTLLRKLSPVTMGIHPCARFKNVLFAIPHIRNLALFSFICMEQHRPASQGSYAKKTPQKRHCCVFATF